MSQSTRYTGLIDRYRERLPVSENSRCISLCEGNTPLIQLQNIPRVIGKEVDIVKIFKEIRELPGTQRFYDPSKPWYPEKDVDRCLHKNRFQFVLKAEPYTNGLVSLKAVPVDM